MTNNISVVCKICKASFRPITKLEKQTNICHVCQYKKDVVAIDEYIQNDYTKEHVDKMMKGGHNKQ